ncbi:MAG: sensor histidine kinase, partial [Pseudomonadota bacterium]|nr:sensor histidine kinase [Pseudomonadota bacterium]
MAEARGRHITLSADHPVPVICRAEDVADILRNLIENAVKYGGSDIQVALSAEKITVSDNGPGIPVEAQEKVFERFYRGAETSAEDGTGLGLSIAAALARRNGMQLNVTAMEDGTGTQFNLYFPKGPNVAGV